MVTATSGKEEALKKAKEEAAKQPIKEEPPVNKIQTLLSKHFDESSSYGISDIPSLKDTRNLDEESADQVDPLPKTVKTKSPSSGLNSYEEDDFDSSGSMKIPLVKKAASQ